MVLEGLKYKILASETSYTSNFVYIFVHQLLKIGGVYKWVLTFRILKKMCPTILLSWVLVPLKTRKSLISRFWVIKLIVKRRRV